MNISDEQLSAFLDAELPEAEMEMIREQLIEDENIANRLAELAMVDEVVAATYKKIDLRPLPTSTTALLAEEANIIAEKVSTKESAKTAKIISFPGLQKFQNALQKHIAIAASVVMVLGLGAFQILHETGADSNWQAVTNVLETKSSGLKITTHGMEIKPRLTFTNEKGEYCRQFTMMNEKTSTENIACRIQGEWKLAVSLTLDGMPDENLYQPATSGSLLDSAVEDMANGEFFDAQDEARVIENHWSNK